MNKPHLGLLCLFLATAVACGEDDDDKNNNTPSRDGGVMSAAATLAPTSAVVAGSASRATGTVTVTQMGTFATVQIVVAGASDGKHGIHIHANGSCADTTADGGTTPAGGAGPHWNPAGTMHGVIGDAPAHAGDLGNVEVADGEGSLLIITSELKVSDLVGKAVVLHAGEDDLRTDPAGNSGARIACGVITGGR